MSKFVLELLCSAVFTVVKPNSWNKHRIGSAALIRGRRLLTFLSQMRCLFEGGTYSGAALIQVNTVSLYTFIAILNRNVIK